MISASKAREKYSRVTTNPNYIKGYRDGYCGHACDKPSNADAAYEYQTGYWNGEDDSDEEHWSTTKD